MIISFKIFSYYKYLRVINAIHANKIYQITVLRNISAIKNTVFDDLKVVSIIRRTSMFKA